MVHHLVMFEAQPSQSHVERIVRQRQLRRMKRRKEGLACTSQSAQILRQKSTCRESSTVCSSFFIRSAGTRQTFSAKSSRATLPAICVLSRPGDWTLHRIKHGTTPDCMFVAPRLVALFKWATEQRYENI